MKKTFLFCSALLTAFPLLAQNLIKDPDINAKPLSPEFRICEDRQLGTLTQFIEQSTWNRCLKLELKKYNQAKNGRRTYALGVLMGGDKKTPGFAVKPDCTYHFSVEVKGKGTRAMFGVREYGKNYQAKKEQVCTSFRFRKTGPFIPVLSSRQQKPLVPHLNCSSGVMTAFLRTLPKSREIIF
jgi:hypothetical protein